MRRLPITLLLAAALLLRLWVALATPILFAPDEVAHVIYVQQFADHLHLPLASLDRAWAIDNGVHEFFQPPLYYIVAAPVYRALEHAGSLAVVGLRMLDVALGTLLVWLSYLTALAVTGGRRAPALAGAALIAFLPTAVANSASANNDSLVNVLVALGAWLLARDLAGSVRTAVAVGLTAGAALDTKLSGAVLVFGLVAWGAAAQGNRLRRLGLVLRGISIAALLSLPWTLGRNVACYGDPLGVNFRIPPTVWSFVDAADFNLVYLPETFWAAFGRIYEIRPLPAAALAIVATLAVLAGIHTRRRNRRLLPLMAMLALNVASVLLEAMRYAGEGQGRYLFASAAALSALVATAVVRAPGRAALAAVPAAGIASLAVIGLLGLPPASHPRVLLEVGQGLDEHFTVPGYDAWVAHRTVPIGRDLPVCRSPLG